MQAFSGILLVIVLNLLLLGPLFAQQTNNQTPPLNQQPEDRVHAPTRAAMLSAVLPGMGQVYNGRWWKVPIIYAGFGAVAYAVNFNNTEYQFWRNIFIAKIGDNPNLVDPYPQIPQRNVERAMNYYRRNLELSYIAGAALYLLNILEASVDAHLLDFDVGEELSLRITPDVTPMQNMGLKNSPAAGVRFTLRF